MTEATYVWSEQDGYHRVRFQVEKGTGIVSHTYEGVIHSDRPGGKSRRRHIAKGAAGLLKDALEIKRAPLTVQRERWDVCISCPEFDLGKCGKIAGCGCHLSAKIRDKGASCPLAKW